MTLPVLRRIYGLVRDGATIVGNVPQSTPSLADDPKEFARLVSRMWRGDAVTQLGKGRVIAGTDVGQALSTLGIAPDFTGSDANENLDFVHRELAEGHIYYVRNSSDESRSIDARFRVSGKAPEIWDAVTGMARPLSYRIEGGITHVPLTLAAEQSLFVVFSKDTSSSDWTQPMSVTLPIVTLDEDWTVAFEPGRGAPASIELARLAPLNEQSNSGVRFFSGEATYTRTFALSEDQVSAAQLFLDLGVVGDIAEVYVNGELAGTAWQTPYRVDVSEFVRLGENSVEIKVANLWVNRLIGDAQTGEEKIAWASVPMYKPDAPLRTAGLIGPVRILASQ